MAGLTRWGILSAGKISHDFCVALNIAPKEHVVTAIAARKVEDAEKLKNELGLKSAVTYGSYESLAKDNNIDVVYIGTINPYHHENAIMLMKAGKNVLCEKPLGMNSREVKEMVAVAKEKNVFFAEGFWSRHFPAYKFMQEQINKGTLGNIRMVAACFGFKNENIIEGTGRIGNNKMGGGALLDVGCYALQFASLIFKEKPQKISATGVVMHGCDATTNVCLQYSGDRVAIVSANFLATLDNMGIVQGDKGKIEVPFIWCPDEVRINGETKKFPLPTPLQKTNFLNSEGFLYEAQAVRQALGNGKKELDEIPHSDSIMMAEIQDEIRRQIGVVYEADKR